MVTILANIGKKPRPNDKKKFRSRLEGIANLTNVTDKKPLQQNRVASSVAKYETQSSPKRHKAEKKGQNWEPKRSWR